MGNQLAERIWVAILVAIALLSLTATGILADTVPGTPIENSATASYAVGGFTYEVDSPVDVVVVDTMPPGSTSATLELLRYDPTGGSPPETVVPTAYLAGGGGFLPIPPPPAPDGSAGSVVDAPQPLTEAEAYRRAEIVFIRLADEDRNADYTVADTLLVSLSLIDPSGDVETVRLTETGASTGVFVGYVSIDSGAGAVVDGRLGAGSNATLRASYVDPFDPLDAHQDEARIDPRGIVFDSTTGAPVDGITVWLLDDITKAPATVYGDDGVSVFPANVVTGSTVTDSSGASYDLAAGEFLFPVVPGGTYNLAVGFPNDAGFAWPTERTDAELTTLAGGPFAVVAGSRGEAFALGPEPVRIDLPVDPLAETLFISKTSDRDVVSPGDFFRYTIKLTSTRTVGPIVDVRISDVLPAGFRYQAASARWSKTGIGDPGVGADGRTLESRIPVLEPGETIELRYVVEAAVPDAGKALSTAQARGGELVSNIARATVVVEDDLRRDRTLILGRVSVLEDGQPTEEGLTGVRILLEDGSYTLTDERGQFHLEDLQPGAHVVQLDVATLPPGYRAVLREGELLAAGSAISRFVDLQGGNAWHVDFHVERTGSTPAEVGSEETEPDAAPEDPSTFDVAWLEQQPSGWSWVLPRPDARPSAPSVRIAIRHPPDESLEVRLNGEKIDAVHRDGTIVAAGKRVAVSIWSGVDLPEGESEIEVVRFVASGAELGRERRLVYLAGAPVRAEVVPELSTLIADGRMPPVIAVRMIDRHGRLAREGLTAPFFVDEPYLPERADDFEVALLPGATAERARFTIEQDGIAHLKLQPTTLSGRVRIRLPLAVGEEEIWADLRDAARDWVLVGIAEGEVGHGTLVDQLEPLAGPDESDTYGDGRVAFYAKGRVRGGWILTTAYDSDKQTADRSTLHGTIDPDAYYLVYAEADGRRPGAASSEKLYLKLERRALAVLFGDYHLNWTVTELAAYRRDFTGLQVTHSGGRLWAGAFASDTAQRLLRDDILGRGITGPYELSGGDIVLFSESVSVEVRDRFRSEIVLSRRPLSRNIDYTIDYDAGTVMLRETLFATDVDLNQQFLVVTYETESGEDDRLTVGGRVELQASPKLRIGATHVDESESEGRDLTGVDARIRLNGRTELRAEVAQTHDPATGEEDQAYVAELAHVGERLQASAYVRQRDEDFGLGQLSGAERGTRKIAVEGNYRLGHQLTVRGLAATEKRLDTNATRERVETSAEFREGPWQVQGGLRAVDDELPDGSDQRSRLVTVGAARSLLDERMRVRVDHEESLSDRAESLDFPRRTRLGLDYRVNSNAEVFAEQEWTDGAFRDSSQLRTGIKSRPWQGGQAFGTISRADGDASSLSAAAGLRQRWSITPKVSADLGLEHSREIGTESSSFGRPPASAPGGDSTAAAAAVTWKPGPWIYSTRLEYRDSDTGDSRNLLTSAQVAPGGPIGFLGGLRLLDSDSGGEDRLGFDLRLGLAYRPDFGRWTVLDRMDFVGEDVESSSTPRDSRKLVNNLLAVYRPSGRWQVSVHNGIKYSREIVDDDRYSGWTHLLGGELRRGLGRRWDVGVHGNALYSTNSRVANYGYGASVGRHLAHNLWASVGYNAAGIEDRDLKSAGFDRDGWFLRFRMKFDQESVRGLLRFLSGRSDGTETLAVAADEGVGVAGKSRPGTLATPTPVEVIDPDSIGDLQWFLATGATIFDPDSVGQLRLHVTHGPSIFDLDSVGRLRVHVVGATIFDPDSVGRLRVRVAGDERAPASTARSARTPGIPASRRAASGPEIGGSTDRSARLVASRAAAWIGLGGVAVMLLVLIAWRRRRRRRRVEDGDVT